MGSSCPEGSGSVRKFSFSQEGGTLWLSSSLPLHCLIDWCTIDLSCSLATADHWSAFLPWWLSLKQAGLPPGFFLSILQTHFYSCTSALNPHFLSPVSSPYPCSFTTCHGAVFGWLHVISPSSMLPSYLFLFSRCENSPFS